MISILLKWFVKDYQNTKDATVRKQYGLLGSFFGLFTNLILFVAKIVIGLMLGLFSIVTDSINNLSDFGNNLMSIIGVKLSAKPADKDHPYGHQRIEHILSLLIAVVIIALALIMLYQGVMDTIAFFQTVAATGYAPIKTLTYPMYVVTMVILSLAVCFKLTQSYVYYALGKRIDSLPLKALSKDSRNDVLATLATMVGVITAWFSSYDIDCFLTVAVAIFVIISGIGILKESVNILIGQTPDPELVNKLINLVKKHKDALGMHDLSLHYYGHIIYGIIHVEVDGSKDIFASHDLCDAIEKEALEQLDIHLTVHMDPIKVNDSQTEEYKELVNQALMSYSNKHVTMHDFRIEEETPDILLGFDLVIPESLNHEREKKELESAIVEYILIKKHVHVLLNIEYDDRTTDFLTDTDAESQNG